MSFYREQLETWLKKIEVDSDSVVDFGGGANPVIDRVKSFNASRYLIIDNGAEEPKIPERKGVFVQYIERDINQESEGIVDEANQSGLGFCLELMEYVWDPVAALRNMAEWLKRGAILYISFPFVYPIHNPPGIDFLRYTQEGAEKLLKETGFIIVDMVPRIAKSPAALRTFYGSDGMHPRKDQTVDHTGYLIKCKKK